MANEISGRVELQVGAGLASLSSPAGITLEALGIDVMAFCDSFNMATQGMPRGLPLDVVVTHYSDNSFTYVLTSSPLGQLTAPEASVISGSGWRDTEVEVEDSESVEEQPADEKPAFQIIRRAALTAEDLVRSSDLFNADWYLERNPDVAESDIDPLDHFVEYGDGEHRDPGPDFSSAWYAREYPDVMADGQTPLLHYLRYGRKEGRRILTVAEAAEAAAEAKQIPDVDADHDDQTVDPRPAFQIIRRAARTPQDLVRSSRLFDPNWYLERNPDVAESEFDPLDHFVEYGDAEHRDPGPGFSSIWYAQKYPDVVADGQTPFLHYIRYGLKEGRQILTVAEAAEAAYKVQAGTAKDRSSDSRGQEAIPAFRVLNARRPAEELVRESGLFVPHWYLRRNPDVAASDFDPLNHFVAHGDGEHRDPGPHFNSAWYARKYPDVIAAGQTPFLHYLRHGHAEGREIHDAKEPTRQFHANIVEVKATVAASELFDADWYRQHYPKFPKRADPLEHFVNFGDSEHMDPGPDFSGAWYAMAYPEIIAAGHTPLLHYLRIGRKEGRKILTAAKAAAPLEAARLEKEATMLVTASPLFQADWYQERYPDAAESDLDPALHFVRFGDPSMHDPGPDFSGRWYAEHFAELANIGQTPFLHYLRSGQEMGLKICSVAAAESALPEFYPEPRPSQTPVLRRWVRHRHLVRDSERMRLELRGVALSSAAATANWTDGPPDETAATLQAFCRIHGLTADDIVRVRRPGAEPLPVETFTEIQTGSVPQAAAVLASEFSDAPLRIDDGWFASDYQLRLRVGHGSDWNGGARVVRGYQFDTTSNSLIMVGEALAAGFDFDLVDLNLVNPLFPILMTGNAPDGRLLATLLVPFPSLFRGGWHWSEGRMQAIGSEPVENLGVTSRQLLKSWLGGIDGGQGFAIAGIDVDIATATGAERIFAPEMRDWLASVMDISLSPVMPEQATSVSARYLAASLTPHSSAPLAYRSANAGLRLQLPADALPSLAALVAPAVYLGSDPAITGSFAVADALSGRPRWAFEVPALDSSLVAAETSGLPASYPHLIQPTMTRPSVEPVGLMPKPLAIRFVDLADSSAAMGEPQSREAAIELSEPRGISVILSVNDPQMPWIGEFAESLKHQAGVDIDVIALVQGDASSVASISARLNGLPHTAVAIGADVADHCAAINDAASSASGQFLLMVDEPVQIEHPLSLKILARIATHKRTATAGPGLVDGNGLAVTGPAPASHGFLPMSTTLGAVPTMQGRLDDLATIFAEAAYPIASNCHHFHLINAGIWRQFGGLDTDQPSLAAARVDFAFRTSNIGFLHLCTPMVAIAVPADITPEDPVLPPEIHPAVFQTSSVLRSL